MTMPLLQYSMHGMGKVEGGHRSGGQQRCTALHCTSFHCTALHAAEWTVILMVSLPYLIICDLYVCLLSSIQTNSFQR